MTLTERQRIEETKGDVADLQSGEMKIVCPSVALKALRFPESTSSTQTAPLATIGGPARKEGPLQETLKEGLGPRLTFSATRPSVHGTYRYGEAYAFPP